MAEKPGPIYLGAPFDGGDPNSGESVQDTAPDSPVNQGDIDLLGQGEGIMEVDEDGPASLRPAKVANYFDELDLETISTGSPASVYQGNLYTRALSQ